MSAKGVVRLTVELPRGVSQFLSDLCQFGRCKVTLKEWAERELVEAVRATIDALSDDEFLVASRLKEKYGLEESKSEDP